MTSAKLIGFPEIEHGQYAVLHAEVATGIVLDVRGARHLGRGDRFLVFDTLDTARGYCRTKVDSDPSIECTIYDHAGAMIESVRPPPASRETTHEKKPWWRW